MKHIMVGIIAGLIMDCCTCQRCHAQDLGPFSHPVQSGAQYVVNATQAEEFRTLILEMDSETLASVLFEVATNRKADAKSRDRLLSATETATINAAQWDRWFNLAKRGSFASLGYWAQCRLAAVHRLPIRATIEANGEDQAIDRIVTPAKQARFIARIQAAGLAPSTESY